MKSAALNAIASVAYKELLHIYRDRRILILLLVLPPLFTVIFGHAFENTELTNVPALLIDRDQTPRTAHLIDILLRTKRLNGGIAPANFRRRIEPDRKWRQSKSGHSGGLD